MPTGTLCTNITESLPVYLGGLALNRSNTMRSTSVSMPHMTIMIRYSSGIPDENISVYNTADVNMP